jgi:hypothetical protein
MISISDLEQVATDRFNDAQCLLNGQRFDGAVYLGGYALEIAFKVRLCKDAGRSDFPTDNYEFRQNNLNTWKTHKLNDLLNQCALPIKGCVTNSLDWQVVGNHWNVEMRYSKSQITKDDTEDFLESVRLLVGVLQ